MPYCKNCRSRIDRFDKDRCPICGTEKPFEGVSSDTVEITTNIDTSELNIDYHPRKRTTFLWLFLLGFSGAPMFYIYKKKAALIFIIANLAFIGASIAALLLATSIHPAISIVAVFVIDMVVNFLAGLSIYNQPNLKDGRGDFLK